MCWKAHTADPVGRLLPCWNEPGTQVTAAPLPALLPTTKPHPRSKHVPDTALLAPSRLLAQASAPRRPGRVLLNAGASTHSRVSRALLPRRTAVAWSLVEGRDFGAAHVVYIAHPRAAPVDVPSPRSPTLNSRTRSPSAPIRRSASGSPLPLTRWHRQRWRTPCGQPASRAARPFNPNLPELCPLLSRRGSRHS